ncbi:MAG: radical SAM protein [Planctomycetes bacterium]|nr:radical SAM protein [Planctomycetota bacterium]MCB9905168.1 radical SAM protein [Planctomycetota bacterium]
MRVLLLNPPSERVVIRDYFCSKTTKSNYLFQPIDLVVLSGWLADEHELSVLDCIAEALSPTTALARIRELDPQVVVALVGSVSWKEDHTFLRALAEDGRRIVGIGDVLHEAPAERLADEPWLEAILDDFACDSLPRYLAGERTGLAGMSVREPDGSITTLPPDRTKRYRVPRPRHELFPTRGYRFSFARRAPFATLLTDYGCPYPCSFCVISTIPFRTRDVADVLEEIDHLRGRGVCELFFMDQTFGVRRERALELCAAFAERGDLSWTAYTRPDLADDELLGAMRAAGCHTVMMGVESADDSVLEEYEKGYRASEVAAAFERARRNKLRTVGTFIIGLPEETESSLHATLKLAIDLDMDFLSLNVAVPRFGTPFRTRAIELGLANSHELVMDQGGEDAFLPTLTLDRVRMLELKRSMVRKYYLRPGYLLRRLLAVRTWHELKGQVREGFALLAKNS